jgi:hypothetical protein
MTGSGAKRPDVMDQSRMPVPTGSAHEYFPALSAARGIVTAFAGLASLPDIQNFLITQYSGADGLAIERGRRHHAHDTRADRALHISVGYFVPGIPGAFVASRR